MSGQGSQYYPKNQGYSGYYQSGRDKGQGRGQTDNSKYSGEGHKKQTDFGYTKTDAKKPAGYPQSRAPQTGYMQYPPMGVPVYAPAPAYYPAQQQPPTGSKTKPGKAGPGSPNPNFYGSPGGSFYNESYYTGDKGSEKGVRDSNTEAASELQSNLGFEGKKYDKTGDKNYRGRNERYDRGKDKFSKRRPKPQTRGDAQPAEEFESGEDHAVNLEPQQGAAKNSPPGSHVEANTSTKKTHENRGDRADRGDRGDRQIREFKRDERSSENDARREEINSKLSGVPLFVHEIAPTVS